MNFSSVVVVVDKEQNRQKFIYTKGCVGQFEKWLQDKLIIVAGIFVGIALLQVSSPTSCLWCSRTHMKPALCLCRHCPLVVTLGNTAPLPTP